MKAKMRNDWLDRVREAPVDPDYAVIDPHHHMWLDHPRRDFSYTVDELGADATAGHKVLATVFVNGIQSTSRVVNVSVPVPVSAPLDEPVSLTNGFQFTFTNSVGALFGVLATTNLSLPLTNWTALGGVTEISPGRFQFTDPQATNGGQRFYKVYSP